MFGVLRYGSDGEGGVGAYGIPSVSQLGGAAQGGRAFAAYPQGRVRLLDGLGREGYVGEAGVVAVEGRIVAGPKLFEDAEVFVADGSALGVWRRAYSLELLLHPADAAAYD